MLGAGSLLTAAATLLTARSASETAQRRLDVDALRLSNDLQQIVSVHTALLSSLGGLYHVHPSLTAAQLHSFVAGGRLLENHPGAQALEFARRVPAGARSTEDVGQRREAIRAGSSRGDPTDPSDDSWVVELVEPLRGNEPALGLDLASEASRRAAIEAACVGARPAATNPVRLVQETGSSPGLVVFSPVYDVEPPPSSAEERRRRCVALAIVVYRTADMLAGLDERNERIRFRLFDLGRKDPNEDDPAPRKETLLFDSEPSMGPPKTGGRRLDFSFHGRQWEFIVTRPRSTLAGLPVPALTVAGFGLGFSLAVSLLVFQLAGFRRQALARGRVVAAGDRDRRSLERDLHDGAQQRLLSVSLVLAKAHERLEPTGEEAALLDSARDELARSLQELRDLAHGLHPAAVSDHGLAVAAQGVVARAPVPVELRLELDHRLRPDVEVAAYYVLSEALANAAKHAHATAIKVAIWLANGFLCIDVRDDGVGGADLKAGSGLRGLTDRVEGLDGTFAVTSRRGRGTWVRARIPYA